MTTPIPPAPAVPPLRQASIIDPADLAAYEQAWSARDAAQTQTVAAQAQEITQLQQQLNPAAAATTVFGMDVAAAGTTTLDQAFTSHRAWTPGGDLPFVRLFSPGQPLTWASPDAKLARTAEHPVFSFKTWDATLFGQWMDGIPADVDQAWVCHYHEPEDDAKRSGNPAGFIAAYLRVYAQMDAARKAHPNGHKVRLVKILSRYQQITVKQAGVTYKEFHGGQDFVDAFGWDCYNDAWYKRYIPADEFLGPVVACSKEIGIPWCVPELGVALQPSDTDGSKRAALLASWVAYLKANGALWASYWCSAQWHLEGTPAQQVWLDAMKANSAA